MRDYVRDPSKGRPKRSRVVASSAAADEELDEDWDDDDDFGDAVEEERGVIDVHRHASPENERSSETEGSQAERVVDAATPQNTEKALSRRQRDERDGRVVDVVLSDMCEPWEQTTGFWKKTISDPYFRMMNASGMKFRDHAGSMVRAFTSSSR